MLKLPCELASYLERAEFPKRGLLKSPVYLLAARYGWFTCPSVRPNLPCVWHLRRISYGSAIGSAESRLGLGPYPISLAHAFQINVCDPIALPYALRVDISDNLAPMLSL